MVGIKMGRGILSLPAASAFSIASFDVLFHVQRKRPKEIASLRSQKIIPPIKFLIKKNWT